MPTLKTIHGKPAQEYLQGLAAPERKPRPEVPAADLAPQRAAALAVLEAGSSVPGSFRVRMVTSSGI